VRQFQPTGQFAAQARPRMRARVAANNQHGMMRGLIHGVILSLAVWLAAGYLTLILR